MKIAKKSLFIVMLMAFSLSLPAAPFLHADDVGGSGDGIAPCEERISSTGNRRRVTCQVEFESQFPKIVEDAYLVFWKASHAKDGWELIKESSSLQELSGPLAHRLTVELIYAKSVGNNSPGNNDIPGI